VRVIYVDKNGAFESDLILSLSFLIF